MDETAFKKAYNGLNLAQKQAVDTIEGPVMVIAGPGTGKTTILTLRIANILLKTDVQPENILALTFTNSGVHAMRKKLLEVIGDTAYRINIFTFHSFAEHVIKEFPSHFDSLEYARVITDVEKVHFLEEIITAGKFSYITSAYDPLSALSSIKKAIDDIKADGLSPEEFEKRIGGWKEEMLQDESVYYKRKTGKYNIGDVKPSELEKIENRVKKAHEIATVFAKYQKKLIEANKYDFSDMILSALRELEENENLKLDVQEQYLYIHVDEHQDTNDGQNKLIELLTDAEHLGGRPNVFTVGDEKQSIYRFQGASDETFTHFKNLYTDVETVALTENYRSTQTILDGSQKLITHTIEDAVTLTADIKEKKPIEVLEFRNYKFELLYVASQIEQLLKDGVSPEEIAIIYRSNKHIDEVKQILATRNIPYSVLSKDNILDDAHIANLFTLFKVVNDPLNNHCLAQSLFVDFLQLDALKVVNVLQTFRKESKKGNKNLIDVLKKDSDFKEYIALISEFKTKSRNTSFSLFFKEVLQTSGYLEHVLSLPDSRDHLRRIYTLFDEIKRQSEQTKSYGLDAFVAFVDALQKYNLEIESTEGIAGEGVQCMTAHKSKGLEFEYVFMVNTSRSNWEKSRGGPKLSLPLDDFKGNIDDERRLFYVSMTRAKKELVITSSLYDWEGKEREQSQFIKEIGEDDVKVIDTLALEDRLDKHLSEFLTQSTPKRTIFDTAYLKTLFLEQNLSVSALNNYITCPLKYFFRNLILVPDTYTPFLVYGNTVHEALELFFIACKEEKKILPKAKLLSYFSESIDKASLYGADYERYKERGEESLGEYYNKWHKTWGVQLATELYIRRQFKTASGDEITLSGMLDKVEYLESEVEGKIKIIDYKTGKAYSEKSSKEQKVALERQIIFYHVLIETYKEGAYSIKEAVLDFVEKTKKGAFEQKTLEVTEEDKARVKEEIGQLASDIFDGSLLEKGCDKKDCESCELYKILKI